LEIICNPDYGIVSYRFVNLICELRTYEQFVLYELRTGQLVLCELVHISIVGFGLISLRILEDIIVECVFEWILAFNCFKYTYLNIETSGKVGKTLFTIGPTECWLAKVYGVG
jgi:hypothetical protein